MNYTNERYEQTIRVMSNCASRLNTYKALLPCHCQRPQLMFAKTCIAASFWKLCTGHQSGTNLSWKHVHKHLSTWVALVVVLWFEYQNIAPPFTAESVCHVSLGEYVSIEHTTDSCVLDVWYHKDCFPIHCENVWYQKNCSPIHSRVSTSLQPGWNTGIVVKWPTKWSSCGQKLSSLHYRLARDWGMFDKGVCISPTDRYTTPSERLRNVW